MAVNRFSKQRAIAQFTPQSLEKMSIVPRFYGQQYQQREAIKSNLSNLNIDSARTTADMQRAKELQSEMSNLIQQDTDQFLKEGFASGDARGRLNNLIKRYREIQTNDVAVLNARGQAFNEDLKQFEEIAEKAKLPGEREWVDAQKQRYIQRAESVPLQSDQGQNILSFGGTGYVDYVDYRKDIMDYFSSADVLENVQGMSKDQATALFGTTDLNNISYAFGETKARAMSAAQALTNAYVNDPSRQSFFLRMNELYGGNSGVEYVDAVDAEGKTIMGPDGQPQRRAVITAFKTDADGNVIGIDASTSLGSALDAAVQAKYGVSYGVNVKGFSKSGGGRNGFTVDVSKLPIITTAFTTEGEETKVNTMQLLNTELEEQSAKVTQLQDESSRLGLNMFQKLQESQALERIAFVNPNGNPGAFQPEKMMIGASRVASENITKSPKEQRAALVEYLSGYVKSPIEAGAVADELMKNSSSNLLEYHGLQEELNNTVDGVSLLQSMRTSKIERIQEKWAGDVYLSEQFAHYATNPKLEGYGSKYTSLGSYEEVEATWGRAVDAFVTDIKSVNEYSPLSQQWNIYKPGVDYDNVDPTLLQEDFETLSRRLKTAIWTADYSEGVPNIDQQLTEIEEDLNYLSLQDRNLIGETGISTVIGRNVQDFIGPVAGFIGEGVSEFFESAVGRGDMEGLDYFSGAFGGAFQQRGRAQTMANLMGTMRDLETGIYANSEAVKEVTDQSAISQGVVFVADPPGSTQYQTYMDRFKTTVTDVLETQPVSNLPTPSGLSVHQYLREVKNIDIPSDKPIDISKMKVNIGFHTNAVTNQNEPTIVLTGQVGYMGDEKMVYEEAGSVHLDVTSIPSIQDQRENMDAILWWTSNTNANASPAQQKAASQFNQIVGSELISSQSLVMDAILHPPQQKETLKINLDPGQGLAGISQIPPVELVTRQDQNGRWEWSFVEGGPLEVFGAPNQAKLGALYERIGLHAYQSIFENGG